MLSCKSCCIAFVLALLLPDPIPCNKTGDVWADAGKLTGLLLHNCLRLSTENSPEKFLILLQDCLKRRSLVALDRMLTRNVLQLGDDVALVSYQNENETGVGRSLGPKKDASRFDDGDEADWKSLVVEKLTKLFRTRVLKIHLNGLNGPRTTAFEGRRRHRHHNIMSQLFMFAMIAAAVIVIPMGFQFLAILGGKALLLAKMALLMTSIQGLKKIATSNLNYGLYSTHGHGPWHYDRQWPYEGDDHVDTYAPGYQGPPIYESLHPRQDLI